LLFLLMDRKSNYSLKKNKIMKKLLIICAMLTGCSTLFAQNPVRISGYTNSYGTYVEPHYRTSPNSTVIDNYSYSGNVNPFTGSIGTKTYESFSNSTVKDNYSYSGNVNSFTGSIGTKTYESFSTPSFSFSTPSYSSAASSTIYTGPRGGTYYINSNGNKTYVK